MITNKYGLPQKIVDIVEGDNYEYTPHRYSATEILNSTKEIILRRRYRDRITIDVSDRINMLFGTAFHSLFETDDEGSEMKVEYPVGNAVLSGRVDEYRNYTVTDYKTATVWKIKAGDFKDWEQQVLIYAWVLTRMGRVVSKGRIVAFLKDFSKGRKAFDKDYPEAQIYVHEFKITTSKLLEIEEFILDKVNEIEKFIDAPNNELPKPTDNELWKTPDLYAVKKDNNKRALKIFDSMADAQRYMIDKKADYIETRPGVYKKLEYDKGLAELFRIGDVETWELK